MEIDDHFKHPKTYEYFSRVIIDKSNKKGFSGADDIADWFKNDKSDDWRQRD